MHDRWRLCSLLGKSQPDMQKRDISELFTCKTGVLANVSDLEFLHFSLLNKVNRK